MIPIKSKEEIVLLRESNRLVARVLQVLKEKTTPGVSTKELDILAEDMVKEAGAQPAFKGYRGYPATICASINEEVVHGIPTSKQILKPGDIVSIDLGVKYKGYYGDATVTLPVGEIDKKAQRIMEVTQTALSKGIDQAKEGNYLHDISWAIQSYVEGEGYSVVRDFVGHGIGKNLHEEPQIPNFGKPHTGPILKEGMVLALEPMVNEGTWEVRVLSDKWTVVTKDGLLSCHFEHTIAVTKDSAVILSKE